MPRKKGQDPFLAQMSLWKVKDSVASLRSAELASKPGRLLAPSSGPAAPRSQPDCRCSFPARRQQEGPGGGGGSSTRAHMD